MDLKKNLMVCEVIFRFVLFAGAVGMSFIVGLSWTSFLAGGLWALFIFSFPSKYNK